MGCKTVFEILNDHNLSDYYNIQERPGTKVNEDKDYHFLENEDIIQRFTKFSNGEISKVDFSIPQIHCSSCIWLLENLGRLNDDIQHSIVNFNKRIVSITFRSTLSLRELVELLNSIGYAPDLNAIIDGKPKKADKTIFYKLGIAGFCFGNIMLLSFPEYLGIDSSFNTFRHFFGYISILLSIPLVFYAGVDYLKNALNGIQQRFMNMDIPIALGIITLFFRSIYEIVTITGSGYLDSLAGLIFFLLLGKWFQQKTYTALSFDRNYKSYFPIAVNKIEGEQTVPTQIEDLKKGDIVEFRNNELIPADGILLSNKTSIDYSFVTGESAHVQRMVGDPIYAGGKIIGSKVRMTLSKSVNNSYLIQLWNQDAFEDKEELSAISSSISKYFTIVILFITAITAVYWCFVSPSLLWNSISSILIVACPCALALSVPFTFGSTIRIMGNRGLYLKNTNVIERLAKITTVILDKTGTITEKGSNIITYKGIALSENEQNMIWVLVSNSLHPYSIAIRDHLQLTNTETIVHFDEVSGKGIQGIVNNVPIKMGSASFLNHPITSFSKSSSEVHVSINDIYKGVYHISQKYRPGLTHFIQSLKQYFNLQLLTGDNNNQEEYLRRHFRIKEMHFSQQPIDKLQHIKKLQKNNHQVLMLGDGLNDAGALKQSEVGIAISDDLHQFSPACDAILEAANYSQLPQFIKFSKSALTIVWISFGLSFLYNIVGLSFAVTGNLSPIVAAILMPLSSITIALFTTFASRISAKRIFKT